MGKCYVDSCSRDALCKGLCDKHYRRLRKNGSPFDCGTKVVAEGDVVARFHAKYVIDPVTGCWNWIGGTRPNAKGVLYGRHTLDDGKGTGAHRFSFEHYTGVSPHGKFVCHRCDNPLCVNPNHLFLSNHAGNMADMVSKGRSFKGRGENKGCAKLTNTQAAEIRASKLSESKLGEIYGISPGAAGNIRRGKAYAT